MPADEQDRADDAGDVEASRPRTRGRRGAVGGRSTGSCGGGGGWSTCGFGSTLGLVFWSFGYLVLGRRRVERQPADALEVDLHPRVHVVTGRGEDALALLVLVGVVAHHDAGGDAELAGEERHRDRVLLVVADHLIAADERRDALGGVARAGEHLSLESVAEEAALGEESLQSAHLLDRRLGVGDGLRREGGELLRHVLLLGPRDGGERHVGELVVLGRGGHHRVDRVLVTRHGASPSPRAVPGRGVHVRRAAQLVRAVAVEPDARDSAPAVGIQTPSYSSTAMLSVTGTPSASGGHVGAQRA